MGIVIIRRVRVVLRTARNTQAFGPAVRSFTGNNGAGITENIADGIGFKTAVRQYVGSPCRLLFQRCIQAGQAVGLATGDQDPVAVADPPSACSTLSGSRSSNGWFSNTFMPN